MKLNFGRKIVISILFLIIICAIGEFTKNDTILLYALIIGFLLVPVLFGWYFILKAKQKKVFFKNLELLDNIIGMNYFDFIKNMDMPKPKGMKKGPKGDSYDWIFVGSGVTHFNLVINNEKIIIDYEINEN